MKVFFLFVSMLLSFFSYSQSNDDYWSDENREKRINKYVDDYKSQFAEAEKAKKEKYENDKREIEDNDKKRQEQLKILAEKRNLKYQQEIDYIKSSNPKKAKQIEEDEMLNNEVIKYYKGVVVGKYVRGDRTGWLWVYFIKNANGSFTSYDQTPR